MANNINVENKADEPIKRIDNSAIIFKYINSLIHQDPHSGKLN